MSAEKRIRRSEYGSKAKQTVTILLERGGVDI